MFFNVWGNFQFPIRACGIEECLWFRGLMDAVIIYVILPKLLEDDKSAPIHTNKYASHSILYL